MLSGQVAPDLIILRQSAYRSSSHEQDGRLSLLSARPAAIFPVTILGPVPNYSAF